MFITITIIIKMEVGYEIIITRPFLFYFSNIGTPVIVFSIF